MSSRSCCHASVDSESGRRWLGVVGWIVPSAILALMPKCPACLAGYVLLWTGLGLSATVTGFLRISLLVLSVGLLAYLLGRSVYRRLNSSR